MDSDKKKPSTSAPVERQPADLPQKSAGPGTLNPLELYGPKGPEPTRYGDWEQKGRCTDF